MRKVAEGVAAPSTAALSAEIFSDSIRLHQLVFSTPTVVSMRAEGGACKVASFLEKLSFVSSLASAVPIRKRRSQ